MSNKSDWVRWNVLGFELSGFRNVSTTVNHYMESPEQPPQVIDSLKTSTRGANLDELLVQNRVETFALMHLAKIVKK